MHQFKMEGDNNIVRNSIPALIYPNMQVAQEKRLG